MNWVSSKSAQYRFLAFYVLFIEFNTKKAVPRRSGLLHRIVKRACSYGISFLAVPTTITVQAAALNRPLTLARIAVMNGPTAVILNYNIDISIAAEHTF